MKGTFEIDVSVMKRLAAEAARQGCTKSELVEKALRQILFDPRADSESELPELTSWKSGGARVDLSDRQRLYEMLDER